LHPVFMTYGFMRGACPRRRICPPVVSGLTPVPPQVVTACRSAKIGRSVEPFLNPGWISGALDDPMQGSKHLSGRPGREPGTISYSKSNDFRDHNPGYASGALTRRDHYSLHAPRETF
jgi:hypothetical protein